MQGLHAPILDTSLRLLALKDTRLSILFEHIQFEYLDILSLLRSQAKLGTVHANNRKKHGLYGTTNSACAGR